MTAFYAHQPAPQMIYGQGWSQVPGQFPTPQYAWPQAQMAQMPMYGQTAMPGWTPVPCQAGFGQHPGMYQAADLMQSGHYAPPYSPTPQLDPVDVLLQELGVKPHEDINFAWIAEYALQPEALAPRWDMHTDAATGRIYYVDNNVGNTSWENPLLTCLRQVIDIGRRYILQRQDEAEHFFSIEKDALWNVRKSELECWHGPFDDGTGRLYFSNSDSGISSWQDPREEMQYMHEIELQLLTALEDTLEPLGPDVLPSFGSGGDDTGMRIEGGAEILTIDSEDQNGSPGKAFIKKPVVEHEDHRLLFEEMVKVADYVHFLHRDEEEVQHLMMSKKVKDRKSRKRREVEDHERKLREEDAIKEAVAAAEEEKKAGIIRQMKEQQRKEEEARQQRLAEEEAARKEQERVEEEQRQKELAEREAEAEVLRLKEERRLQELEEKRLAELEKRQRSISCIEHAMASRKLENLRTALAEGIAGGLEDELLEPLRTVMKEVLIASVEDICKCHDVAAMQLAIVDYEAFGMPSEAEVVRKAMEEELAVRKATLEKKRKEKEQLAAQFKDAKEAQDFGGAILAAQWRAAVRELSKPNP